MFKLFSSYKPTGDQQRAIKELVEGVSQNSPHQVLLGVTGSGKTFTVANLIEKINKPVLIISHNKTLAAQLYQEFRDYFPKNAVEYFVSYYDYFQPESYIPQTDTYIEKDSDINEEIDKLRLSATNSLITRKDVIVVSSVSCIYNLGSPTEYSKVSLELKRGMKIRLSDITKRLSHLYYERNDFEFKRGTYRIRGENIDIYPAYQDYGVHLEVFNEKLSLAYYFEPLNGNRVDPSSPANQKVGHHNSYQEPASIEKSSDSSGVIIIFPAKHYVTPKERQDEAMLQIENDLVLRVKELKAIGKDLEAYRLEQRTKYDLEMIREIGYCKGIENYSRYFDGRVPGGTPSTLMDFFPKDYLLVIDESHITVPQIRGMYNGDQSRKKTLIDYGFRLPSAADNRPLRFEEFMRKVNCGVYVSATPNEWEVSMSSGKVVEQLTRPTGITDPKVTILPTKGQVDDLVKRIKERVSKKERILVTTLTKRMAEELSNYLLENQIKTTYLHSDIATLERTDILDNLRRGEFDVLVGINLLREGLDLPEVSLVAIMDADKEGFLRSETSLIQTMGRAARHVKGEVVMYADVVTGSMTRAIAEVDRRRKIQETYNKEMGITPVSISKPVRDKLVEASDEMVQEKASLIKRDIDYASMPPFELKKEIKRLEEEMKYNAEILNFEAAAILRDKIRKLRELS